LIINQFKLSIHLLSKMVIAIEFKWSNSFKSKSFGKHPKGILSFKNSKLNPCFV